MKTRWAAATLLAGMGLAHGVQAQDQSEWIVRTGVHSLQPKSHNHALVEVGNQTGVTFSATYMLAPHWGAELLAAMPFVHEISLSGGSRIAEVNQLPPTFSLQYHFNPTGAVRPYIGAGLNYTLFFDERTSGPLEGRKLELDPSLGPAAQLGLDVDFAAGWFINLDARWFDIDSDAKLDGVGLGTVEIDPYAIGLSIGHRF